MFVGQTMPGKSVAQLATSRVGGAIEYLWIGLEPRKLGVKSQKMANGIRKETNESF